MVILLVFLVCFLASVAGAICGIGGGVIIKPALDAFGIMDVATISFLSGCTVLSMTTYSVLRSRRSGASAFERATGLPMALGAAVGGVWRLCFGQAAALSRFWLAAGVALCVLLGVAVYALTAWRLGVVRREDLPARLARRLPKPKKNTRG